MKHIKTHNPCDDCEHSFSKNNQQSDICKRCEFKRLQVENENLRDNLVKKRFKDEMFEMTLKEYTDGKIKEFAEKLKRHSYFDHKDQRNVVAEIIIDHYLKEKVGEENVSEKVD